MAKIKVPYLVWRDGRPRWIPSPELRRAGHKGRDLKDDAGAWLTLGDAATAAAALNLSIKSGAASTPLPPVQTDRGFSALFKKLRATAKWQGGAEDSIRTTGRLSPRTRRDYLEDLAILENWCGDIPVEALTRIDIENFYLDQVAAHGATTTNAMMRTFSIALNFAVDLEWAPRNRVAKLNMIATPGRLVMYPREEIAALVGAADYLGLFGMGDAIVLALTSGQREQDLLVLPEGDMTQGHYVINQKKRGAIAYVPQTKPLVARVHAARARKKALWPNVTHQLEIIQTRTGKPYHPSAKQFRKDFALVRFVAAGGVQVIDAMLGAPPRNMPFTPQPAVLDKFFADLRDTAVTILAMAGLTKFEIANITGHTLATVETILQKHYFVRNAELAVSGGIKQDAYFDTWDIRWA